MGDTLETHSQKTCIKTAKINENPLFDSHHHIRNDNRYRLLLLLLLLLQLVLRLLQIREKERKSGNTIAG